MISLYDIGNDHLTVGVQLMRDEFLRRGWRVEVPYNGSSICYIDRGDGKPLVTFSATPPSTSYSSGYQANDKFACYALLEKIGARQLKSAIVSEKNGDQAARELLREYGKVVVKPIDGGHGKGITVNVTTDQQFDAAVDYAMQFAKNSPRAIVQRQYDHAKMYDLRVLCINGKYIAATLRIAARVYGDGTHTIKELIERENNSPNRGAPYHAPLAMIDPERAKSYLGDEYETIPENGAEVQVMGVGNYGAGGEIIDATDDIPEWMIVEAEKVSLAAGLYVCGVDYLLAVSPRADATNEELDPVIIELNKCPSLAIHDAPTQGKNRGATAAYVEYLASLPAAS